MKISSWDRIVTSAPSNKDAAMAFQGTYDDPTLTPHQMRENYIAIWTRVEAELKDAPVERRKELIVRKREIEAQLSALKANKPRDKYASQFVEAARDLLPKAMFRLIGDEAARRCDALEESAGDAAGK